MQKDESRAIIIEEMQDGEARVTVGGELSVSKEIRNGHWMGAKAFCTVSINCPQTEEGMLTAMNIAEEMAFEKVYELTSSAETTINDEQQKALAGRPSGGGGY